jgi:hypothetical protein
MAAGTTRMIVSDRDCEMVKSIRFRTDAKLSHRKSAARIAGASEAVLF